MKLWDNRKIQLHTNSLKFIVRNWILTNYINFSYFTRFHNNKINCFPVMCFLLPTDYYADSFQGFNWIFKLTSRHYSNKNSFRVFKKRNKKSGVETVLWNGFVRVFTHPQFRFLQIFSFVFFLFLSNSFRFCSKNKISCFCSLFFGFYIGFINLFLFHHSMFSTVQPKLMAYYKNTFYPFYWIFRAKRKSIY